MTRSHIIQRFEAWWKIANMLLGLFVENVEKDRCVGSIFGNQFHFLLMSIQGSTCNHENERKTNNLGWMLYSVYAVLGVCCTQYMLYLVYAVLDVNWWSGLGGIERDDSILCSAMMVELWTRTREMGDEDENDVEAMSGYEKSGVRLAWLGWEDLVSVYSTPDRDSYLLYCAW